MSQVLIHHEIYGREINVHRISELRYRKRFSLGKSEIRGTNVKLALVFIGIHLK